MLSSKNTNLLIFNFPKIFSQAKKFSKLIKFRIEFQNDERSVAFDTRFTGGGESLSQKLYRSTVEKYTQEQCQRGVNSSVTPCRPRDLPRKGEKLSRDILSFFSRTSINWITRTGARRTRRMFAGASSSSASRISYFP